MKLAILGGLVLLILGLPVAMGQEVPSYPEKGSCPVLGDRAVKPLADQCLDPGNGGSAVCGSYNCFTECQTVTVYDCTLRWACIAGETLCVLWSRYDPWGVPVCMATVFVCNAFGWVNECIPRQEERCQTRCVR